MSDCEGAIVKVKIKNFRGRKRCPYCGVKPEEMEWSPEGIRIWCENPKCNSNYKIFVAIPEEELDLVKMTRKLISDWGNYCKVRKVRVNA